eukprot:Amastigsp_a447_135.p2 type:complete len:223 gc:universal Amastigsp_a447_135:710-42(-)
MAGPRPPLRTELRTHPCATTRASTRETRLLLPFSVWLRTAISTVARSRIAPMCLWCFRSRLHLRLRCRRSAARSTTSVCAGGEATWSRCIPLCHTHSRRRSSTFEPLIVCTFNGRARSRLLTALVTATLQLTGQTLFVSARRGRCSRLRSLIQSATCLTRLLSSKAWPRPGSPLPRLLIPSSTTRTPPTTAGLCRSAAGARARSNTCALATCPSATARSGAQ